MKSLYAAALVVVVCLVIVSFSVLLNPQPPTRMMFRLYPDLMPGQPMPVSGASCDWMSVYYSDHMIFCRVDRPGAEDISFNFDVNTHKINSVGYLTINSRLKVGDLMLLWGKPSGYSYDKNSTTVYWGSTAAYIVSRSLTPGSSVGVVSSFSEPELIDQWRGFR